mgnify:CR=1 FL=1
MLIMKVSVDVSTSPPVAAEELCKLAAHLGVTVRATADLYGVEMVARPGDTAAVVFADYEREVRLSNYPES